MRRSKLTLSEAFRRHRSGQLSTAAIVFIVLGVCFFLAVLAIGVLAMLLMPAISQARAAAQRTQSMNNLKQIGLALHNYHDTYNTFPPGGIYTADKTPYNSWMTSILPFVEYSHVYSSIDMNQPWSAPQNQAAFTTIVPIYLQPAAPPDSMIVGSLAAAHYAGNSQVLLENSGMRMAMVTDGTSNTLLGGEVAGGFMAWGDPANRRDPAKGIGPGPDQFGSMNSGSPGANMLLMDGSVRFISTTISPEVMQNLADPDGGVFPSEF